jgi:hypothetical protein
VRQPNWGFQDQPLTRKSSDWESTNIGLRSDGPADSCLTTENPITFAH